MKTIDLGRVISSRAGQVGVLTCGATTPDGRTLVGVFSSETDARSQDADSLAVAIVALSDLPASLQAMACENTDSI